MQAEDGIGQLIVTGVQTCVLFFSSRRRHTRSDRDWSSDVCSSDLIGRAHSELQSRSDLVCRLLLEIGRASCRERVYISVVAVSVKRKQLDGGARQVLRL